MIKHCYNTSKGQLVPAERCLARRDFNMASISAESMLEMLEKTI